VAGGALCVEGAWRTEAGCTWLEANEGWDEPSNVRAPAFLLSRRTGGDVRARLRLFAPGRLVRLLRLLAGDQDAGRPDRAADEMERGRRAAVAEQPASRSEHGR